jgi:hypothetical protein
MTLHAVVCVCRGIRDRYLAEGSGNTIMIIAPELRGHGELPPDDLKLQDAHCRSKWHNCANDAHLTLPLAWKQGHHNCLLRANFPFSRISLLSFHYSFYPKMSTSHLRSYLITTILFSVSCLLLLEIYHPMSAKYRFIPSNGSSQGFSTKFSRQKQYMNMSSNYDHLWDSLLPENGGMVEVEGTDEIYGLSMFHQVSSFLL